jgi:hypothetical protein
MASAEIQFPITGYNVLFNFTAFGVTTADNVVGLLRLIKDPEIIYAGNLVVMDHGFWAVQFTNVPWSERWQLEIYEAPGFLLARVPNLFIGQEFGVGIQYPRSTFNPIPNQFIAQGTADPGGMPAGTMTLQLDGSQTPGTQVPGGSGKNWRLRFAVNQSTSKYNLHIDVAGNGADSNDLCAPPQGQQCV